MYPTTYKYTKDHEWLAFEGDTATIGITDFAQQELGEIVYVDLPSTGTQITAGEVFGSVESVKAVSDIYAPVSGEVIEVNSALESTPEIINSDPHGEGWLIKVAASADSAAEDIMDAAGYEKFLQEKAEG